MQYQWYLVKFRVNQVSEWPDCGLSILVFGLDTFQIVLLHLKYSFSSFYADYRIECKRK